MRICIPSGSDAGLASSVARHLGRAPFLTLVGTESGDVIRNAPHGEGSCAPAEPLSGTGVEAVVCAGAGRHAVEVLGARGVGCC